MERRIEILNQQPLMILRQPRKRSVLFFFFLLLFVVGFVSVFRAITSMAEPSEEEEVKAERINRQCNLQRRVSLHVK